MTKERFAGGRKGDFYYSMYLDNEDAVPFVVWHFGPEGMRQWRSITCCREHAREAILGLIEKCERDGLPAWIKTPAPTNPIAELLGALFQQSEPEGFEVETLFERDEPLPDPTHNGSMRKQ